MVDKISINVSVLSLNVQHNFMVPVDMNVADAIRLVAQTVAEEYPGVKNKPAERNRMIRASDGNMLNPACSFKQQGILSGEKIVLI